jgi:hypothetical protein
MGDTVAVCEVGLGGSGCAFGASTASRRTDTTGRGAARGGGVLGSSVFHYAEVGGLTSRELVQVRLL